MVEALGISLKDFIFYLINFLILVAVLGKFLYKPFVNALKDRKLTIKAALENAEMINRKADITQKLISRGDGVEITIGGENQDADLSECSVITATYHVDGRLVGKLGVIGPTRMKYDEVTSVIKYLTDNLSKTFEIEAPQGAEEGNEIEDISEVSDE